jgi:glyoxylase-like metal-dependent hydrolase (beta-lactamase superfamily II)
VRTATSANDRISGLSCSVAQATTSGLGGMSVSGAQVSPSVLRRLAATDPAVVVPGHGDISGPQGLTDVRDYLELLRDETWVRRDSAMGEETIVAEVRALMIERHPRWAGQEWIEGGVGCLRAEHP